MSTTTSGTVSTTTTKTTTALPAVLTGVTGTETVGGVFPGLPRIALDATFQNNGLTDLLASDPTLALSASFTDQQFGGTSIASATVPLTASITAGAQGSESVGFYNLGTTYRTIWVTCAIVKVDPATGKVLAVLTPLPPQPTRVDPPIQYVP